MTKADFEAISDKCCAILTNEARATGFKSSAQFESRVREVLDELTRDDISFTMDFAPHPLSHGIKIAFGQILCFNTLRIRRRSHAGNAAKHRRVGLFHERAVCFL
jgi:hypothetical protein